MILFRFFYWKFIDFFRFVKNYKHRKVHLYGIELLTGLYGQGKTISLVQRLDAYRAKYGDKILISTNFGYADEDFPLDTWEDLLPEHSKPVIFGFDEVQNQFTSRDFKNFPIELLSLLTQNRKGNGKLILCTAQSFMRVDKIFRELCQSIGECKTFFGRLTRVKYYRAEEYAAYLNTVDIDKKFSIRPYKKVWFVQSDKLRNSYDSFKMLESAKSKKYMTLEERALMKTVNN